MTKASQPAAQVVHNGLAINRVAERVTLELSEMRVWDPSAAGTKDGGPVDRLRSRRVDSDRFAPSASTPLVMLVLAVEVDGLLRDLAQDGMSMLLVTHEMRFAHEVSDTVIFMNDGRIGEMGDPREIFRAPATERLAEFLKTSTFN